MLVCGEAFGENVGQLCVGRFGNCSSNEPDFVLSCQASFYLPAPITLIGAIKLNVGDVHSGIVIWSHIQWINN